MGYHMAHHSSNSILHSKLKPKGGESPPTFHTMLTNITPNDAYLIVKDWHITEGWEPYALIYAFQAEWERHEGRPVDLHDTIVYWNHYKTLKELKKDYPDDWHERIEDGYTFKVNISDHEESDDKGYKKEYLIQD